MAGVGQQLEIGELSRGVAPLGAQRRAVPGDPLGQPPSVAADRIAHVGNAVLGALGAK